MGAGDSRVCASIMGEEPAPQQKKQKPKNQQNTTATTKQKPQEGGEPEPGAPLNTTNADTTDAAAPTQDSKEVEKIDLNDPALNQAALKIQKVYRGHKTRKEFPRRKANRTEELKRELQEEEHAKNNPDAQQQQPEPLPTEAEMQINQQMPDYQIIPGAENLSSGYLDVLLQDFKDADGDNKKKEKFPVFVTIDLEESQYKEELKSTSKDITNAVWTEDSYLGRLRVSDYKTQALRINIYKKKTIFKKGKLIGFADIGLEDLAPGVLGQIETPLTRAHTEEDFGAIHMTVRFSPAAL